MIQLTNSSKSGFTLLEILLVITIMGILAGVAIAIIAPSQQIERTKRIAALNELTEIGKAVGFYAADNGAYPADKGRGVPPGIGDYIQEETTWPNGPWEGSLYDYDNWSTSSCIDPEASGTIQISLRNIPGMNPDGTDNWTWYYVIQGKGTPHCNNATDVGECVNCEGFDPFAR